MLAPDYSDYDGRPRYLDVGDWDGFGFDWDTGTEYEIDDFIY